jgi:excinuclease UvrABC nuclease subunit
MAERNAEEKVEQQFAAWEAETKKIEGALGGLQTLLGLPHLPRRIEGYDISHLGGSATVGSMVVMVNGKPKREHYRSFNMKTVIDGEIDDYKSIAETLLRRLKYLAHTKKFEDAELARRGLMMSKARKADQKAIEKIIADNASMLGSFGIEYKNFIVVRRDDNIVAVAQLYSYEESVQAIRTVWVADSERGHRLGQTLVRRLLRDITKGKVYATIPPDLEEYYGELGFQIVKQGPDVLTKLLDEYMKKDETNTRGIIVMYQAKDHKIDESFSSMPDLLLIDGGKGQLSAVVDVLQELHLDIPVAGLAKREEEIFVPGQSYPLLVKEGSEPRFLLQRLRDEAHRFANDRRERRLTVAMTASKLDAVPGIGDSTRITLLKKFGSTDAVISASDTALREVLSEGQVKALREMYP